ncbi:MAG: hypothetical protein NZ740_09405 [Kiritimatiellae bacterium]|nr:hypothetical protein [Kiritimatiellia bacterium]MDW8459310.1 hypothetical protein [Verrucomicrobiota bacterium]
MTPTLYDLLRWVHILSMIGVFGGLLVFQLAVPKPIRRDPAVVSAAVRLWNTLLAVGFLSAVWMYLMAGGLNLGGHYQGVVGLKLLLLIAVGALLPISKRQESGDRLRMICIGLLLLASFSAFTI